MPDLTNLFRWIHILAGAAWLGEVATVVFILIPALGRLQAEARTGFLANVFPRVFRWASTFAGLTLLAGLGLNYRLTHWHNLPAYFASSRGFPILVGGVLGLLLAAFHFIVESRIEGRVLSLVETTSPEEERRLLAYLTWIPRVGLLVMVLIFFLMMVGARGY